MLGLHNLFNITDSVYDVSSVKSIASGSVDLDSVAYIIADATDGPVNSGSQAHPTLTYKSVKIGNMTNTTPINVGDAFIWTRGKIYSGNTLAGGGGAAIDWNVTGDNWIDADFTSNNDGSVTVTINHQNLATGTAVSTDNLKHEVNGTSSSGGYEVITGFKLDSNGHVTDVVKTTIYATPVTIDKTGTSGTSGTYISDVSLSGQELTFSKKNDGVFAEDTGTTPGQIVVTTDTKNKVAATQIGIHTQGNATTTMSSTDSEVPTNKAVLQAIQNATVPTMEFKGTTYSLPSTSEEGDMYKLVLPDPEDPQHATTITIPINKSADGSVHTAKNGDTIIANSEGKWWLVPSGDDVEDTWRAIKIKDILGNVTNWKGNGLDTGDLGFEDTGYISVGHQGDYLQFTHNGTNRTNTTDTSTLSNGGTFTAITGVLSNTEGHVTEVNTRTYTLPTIDAPGDGKLTVTSDTGSEDLFTANQATGTDSTLKIKGGSVITTNVDETSGVVEVTVDHDELTAAQKIVVAPSDPSTNTNIDLPNGATVVISGITVNDYGHVTSVTKKKITSDKVNDVALTVTGNDLNKTIVIYADSASMPSSGGSASSFTSNDDTAATYHIDYTGASDAVDWATIGIS